MSNICGEELILRTAYGKKLSERQCQKLYWACLEILERTGVLLYEEAAIDLLKSAGAIINGNHARIPSGLVEKAFSTVPRKITLCDLSGKRSMPIEGRRTFFGPGADCPYIIDHKDNQRRRAVLGDVVEGVTVCDSLSHLDFVMSMFLPSDVDQRIADRYQMEIMLKHSTKPIFFCSTELSGCQIAVEMAEVVAGGARELEKNPRIACYINVTTGLRHNKEALQKLLFLSEKRIPFSYCPNNMGGVTAPITVAASMAMWQAGGLVGLVLSQLKKEGAPFIMPGWGGNMLDMRTTVQPYADPEKRAQSLDFAHYLGLPMFNQAGTSDSKAVDQQAAAEAALTLFTDALFGGNIVHDVGYLESGLSSSLVQLAICDEIIDWLKAFVKEVEISDETLCLDLIHEIGPNGQFMQTTHTMENYKKRWYPSLFDRSNYNSWRKKGAKTLRERATEKVQRILAEPGKSCLPQDAIKDIHAIVERSERELN
ncbi:MAG: trimethylamine methyltransferase family protein [Thermodesulfobacteriota bacterium]